MARVKIPDHSALKNQAGGQATASEACARQVCWHWLVENVQIRADTMPSSPRFGNNGVLTNLTVSFDPSIRKVDDADAILLESELEKTLETSKLEPMMDYKKLLPKKNKGDDKTPTYFFCEGFYTVAEN